MKQRNNNHTTPQNLPAYQAKKAFFQRMLTIYGRKSVLEALQNKQLDIYKIHCADSNKPAPILNEIKALAQERKITVQHHSKQALSRISKNARQDQGIAADIKTPLYPNIEDFLQQHPKAQRILALDGITNPQNVGMIIRSAAAAGIDALLLSQKGNAELGPLVIKASAGTLFKQPLIRCQQLPQALSELRKKGFQLYSLEAKGKHNLLQDPLRKPAVFILGNESDGVSKAVNQLCDEHIRIPMHRDVESLNVAVTAALIAYLSL